MIYIKEKTLAEAWRKSFKELHTKGKESQESEFYRFSYAVIEITDTASTTDLYDTRFPISQEDITIINNYLLTGKEESKVIHEWTRLYRQRLFNKDYNQVENIIEYFKKKSSGKRAQMSIWDQQTDLYGKIGPCLQVIWLQIMDKKLEMHVHMRASDCYGKLLMNMNEFVALQNYIAKKLNVQCGSYVQFTDSLHFNSTDKTAIDKIINEI